jgi:hypothetical protein
MDPYYDIDPGRRCAGEIPYRCRGVLRRGAQRVRAYPTGREQPNGVAA